MLSRRILQAILLLGVALSAAGKAAPLPMSSPVFFKAIDALHRGNLSQAAGLLDQIPMDAPEYVSAYLEMQKINYRTANWDRFFGYAAFYRKHLLKAAPNASLLMLEVLALLKHCQYDAAEKIFEAVKPYTTREDIPRFQAVADILNLQRTLEGRVRTQPASAPFEVLTPTVHWLIPEAVRDQVLADAVKNPRAMRVLVKSACKGLPNHEGVSQ